MRRLMHGGFESHGALEDALLLAVVETGVPIWALDDATLDGPLGIRAARCGRAAAARRTGSPTTCRRGASSSPTPPGRSPSCSASRTPGTRSRAGPSGSACSRSRSPACRTSTSRRRCGPRSKPAGRGRARLGAVVVLIDPYAQDLTLGPRHRAGRAGSAAHAARPDRAPRGAARRLRRHGFSAAKAARCRSPSRARTGRACSGSPSSSACATTSPAASAEARRALTARGARAGARAGAARADAARARPAQVRARRRGRAGGGRLRRLPGAPAPGPDRHARRLVARQALLGLSR